MKKIRMIIFGLCIAVILFAGWNAAGILADYGKSRSAYSSLEEFVTPTTAPAPTAKAKDKPASAPQETEEPERMFPQVDFAALRRVNSEIVGWIQLEDTSLNYPIAQHKDNDYYLKHLYTGETNPSGCIFLDSTNSVSFSDRNNIIYGHCMNDGSMFALLGNYKNQEYYDAHPRLLLMTPRKNYVVELFSGYVLSGWGDAWRISFTDDEDFDDWLTKSAKASCFKSDVIPVPGDKILTLSTCTYEFDDARFVLLGILQEE